MRKSERNNSKHSLLKAAIVACLVIIFGCSTLACSQFTTQSDGSLSAGDNPDAASLVSESSSSQASEAGDATQAATPVAAPPFSASMAPPYSGSYAAIINDDLPFFSDADLQRSSFEEYSPLDSLGRCGPAMALVGRETMPTKERDPILTIKPTGWQTPAPKYDWVDGRYLYNRCHLLGYQLTAENDNALNLITGTRSMNVKGMEPLEDAVNDFIERTGMHVLLRVTPCFDGDNLLASGVLMEAQSVEDGGQGLRFCRWCYNVEPGVVIDYATGANWAAAQNAATGGQQPQEEREASYILNTRSHKFHRPECEWAASMRDKNRQEFFGTRSKVLEMGYVPCNSCNP